jgi:hypothetical protein
MTQTLHALLREHTPLSTSNVAGNPEPLGIQCKCDGVWRGTRTYATHVAGVLLDAGYESSEPESPVSGAVLAGVDRAEAELVRRDCFSSRTLTILDELRARIIADDNHTNGSQA